MKYANKECAGCHVVLPANQMVKRSQTTYTGRSDRFSKVGGNTKHVGHTEHRANKTIFLCAECDEARRKAGLRFLLIAAVVVVALIAFSLLREGNSRVQASSEAGTQIDPLRSVPVDDAARSSEDGADADGKAQVEEAKHPEPTEAAAPDQPSASATPKAASIDSWIQMALTDDRNTEWSQGDARGMIIVEPASGNVGTQCRSYTAKQYTASTSIEVGRGVRCRSTSTGRWEEQ